MGDQNAEEGILVAEALIKGADRTRRRSCDLGDRQGIEVALGDKPAPGGEETVAGALAAALFDGENAVGSFVLGPGRLTNNMKSCFTFYNWNGRHATGNRGAMPANGRRSDVASKWGRVAAMAALALVLATGAARAAGLTELRVANFQNAIVLALFQGIDKGYFKEAGLDVEVVNVATGAASVAAVASGQADIGWAAVTVPIFARSNGVPVKAFLTASQEGPPDHFGTFLDVSARSGVKSFSDLKGKTIMINAFGTAGEVAIRERLLKAGVSWDDVKKIVVPFPQMPAALELGNADLAVEIEPMHTAIMNNKNIGARTLNSGTLAEAHDGPVTGSVYFATDRWLAKNQGTALAFGRAYLRAQKDLEADPQLRIALVMKVAGLEQATAEKIPGTWFKELTVEKAALSPNYDVLVRTGMMTTKFNVDDVIATLPY